MRADRTGPRRRRWRRRLIAIPTLAGAILALLLIPAFFREARSEPVASRCGVSQSGQAGLTGEVEVTVKPPTDELSELKFGRSRAPRGLDFHPGLIGEIPDAGTPVATEIRPFTREDGATLAIGQVVVTHSVISNNEERLNLTVCMDPLYPEAADAGVYKGSVIIDDLGFDSAEIPMSVMLQQTPASIPIGLVAIGVVGAVGWQLLLSMGEKKPVPGHQRLVEIAVGIVAAGAFAVPVYLSQYESNGAWTARPGEMAALVSASFAAAVAAWASVTTVVRKTRNGSSPSSPEDGGDH